MKIYRKIYIKHNGFIPKDETGRTYDIHHIDGNHSNNEYQNLKAVSIQEHFDIHYAQGDWSAAAAIAKRMMIDNTDLNRLGGLLAKENKCGIHGLSFEQRQANGRKGGLKIKGYVRWNNGVTETASPICPGEGWVKGGLPKKSPCIKPGTKLGRFWNNGKKNIRSIDCPGEGWIRGKLLSDEQRKRRSEIGYKSAKSRWDKIKN